MTKPDTLIAPHLDDETITRWWVQLNCWVWPDDLPHKPTLGGSAKQAICGAWAVVDALAAQRGLLENDGPIDQLWMDKERRYELVR